MSTVVVAGAGMAGLATALAAAQRGHRVVVIERDGPPPAGPAAEAAERWSRPSAPQVSHSHTLTSLGVRVLRTRAPRVLAAALDAGALLLDLPASGPAGAADRSDEATTDLVALGCRRSTVELVLHRAVLEAGDVVVRHGRRVEDLLLDRSGRRVAGVVTDDGERVAADVVVDATGWRSAARSWLRAARHAVPADLTSPSGVRGYSRFYRLRGPGLPGPLNRGNAAGVVGDHYAGVLHPGDSGTFSIALAVLPEDAATRTLRDPSAFTAVAAATPGLGPWLAAGVADPISPVHAITTRPNGLRGHATSPRQPVAGLFSVGDAAGVTNPLFGRGMSLALAHAFTLVDLLDAHPDPGPAQGRLVAAATEELLLPWYLQSAEEDRERIARWRAAITGAAPTPAPASPGGRPTSRTVGQAAAADPVVWRGLTRVLMGLATPAEVFDDEGFRARVRDAVRVPAPAPTRAAVVRAAAGGS
ncbi:FAD-dependent oxidoreductase [Actinosynnema sp. NPDC091369]